MPENPKSQREQFLDELLDASLREYGRSQPRAGLETRVLRRLAEAPKSSWMTAWHWSALGAVATVVVVALALITYPPETRMQPGASPQPSVSPRTAVPAPNRAPRFNKTIQESGGVRPGVTSGVKPPNAELPPCKPGEQPRPAATKTGTEKPGPKTQPDCVPVPPEPQATPPPR